MDGERKNRASDQNHLGKTGAEILRVVRRRDQPFGSGLHLSGPAGIDSAEATVLRSIRTFRRNRNREIRAAGRGANPGRDPNSATSRGPFARQLIMELKTILEAILFSAQKPMSPRE